MKYTEDINELNERLFRLNGVMYTFSYVIEYKDNVGDSLLSNIALRMKVYKEYCQNLDMTDDKFIELLFEGFDDDTKQELIKMNLDKLKNSRKQYFEEHKDI